MSLLPALVDGYLPVDRSPYLARLPEVYWRFVASGDQTHRPRRELIHRAVEVAVEGITAEFGPAQFFLGGPFTTYAAWPTRAQLWVIPDDWNEAQMRLATMPNAASWESARGLTMRQPLSVGHDTIHPIGGLAEIRFSRREHAAMAMTLLSKRVDGWGQTAGPHPVGFVEVEVIS